MLGANLFWNDVMVITLKLKFLILIKGKCAFAFIKPQW